MEHSEKRTNWELSLVCPIDPDHLTVDAEATNATPGPEETITLETCPACGSDLEREVTEESTGVFG